MDNKIKQLLNLAKNDAKNGSLDSVHKTLKEIKRLLIMVLLKDELSDIDSLLSDDPKVETSHEDVMRQLEDIATSKQIDGKTHFLLHRPTETAEYKVVGDGGNVYRNAEITEWYAEAIPAAINQKLQNPVVSVWVPHDKISAADSYENTGTWGDLGENPFAGIYTVRVLPGEYQIYQEIRQQGSLNVTEDELSKSREKLEKDVGRITFPNVLTGKETRPDMDVAEVTTPRQADMTIKQMATKMARVHDPETAKYTQPHIESQFSPLKDAILKPDQGFSAAHEPTQTPVGNIASRESNRTSSSYIREHEGLHGLVFSLANKYGGHQSQFYKAMNAQLSHGQGRHIDLLTDALREHRGYDDPTHELVTSMRDALVDKGWRQKVLGHLPPENARHQLQLMKRDWQKVRNWAKNLTHEDMQEIFNKRAKKSNTQMRKDLAKKNISIT